MAYNFIFFYTMERLVKNYGTKICTKAKFQRGKPSTENCFRPKAIDSSEGTAMKQKSSFHDFSGKQLPRDHSAPSLS